MSAPFLPHADPVPGEIPVTGIRGDLGIVGAGPGLTPVTPSQPSPRTRRRTIVGAGAMVMAVVVVAAALVVNPVARRPAPEPTAAAADPGADAAALGAPRPAEAQAAATRGRDGADLASAAPAPAPVRVRDRSSSTDPGGNASNSASTTAAARAPAVPSVPAPSTSPPGAASTALRDRNRATAAPVVLVVGDETAGDVALALEGAGERIEVRRLVLDGCAVAPAAALATAEVEPEALDSECVTGVERIRAAVEDLAPDLTLSVWGPGAVGDVVVAGERRSPLDERHATWVARSWAPVAAAAAGVGGRLVWATTPLMWPPDQPLVAEHGRVQAWNTTVREHLSSGPDVGWIDIGTFVERLGDGPFDPAVRPDGIRLADPAMARLGEALTSELVTLARSL